MGIDLNNTNIVFKTTFGPNKEPFYAKVCLIQYRVKNRFKENIMVIPFLKALK